jgi:hypothetical protein
MEARVLRSKLEQLRRGNETSFRNAHKLAKRAGLRYSGSDEGDVPDGDSRRSDEIQGVNPRPGRRQRRY